MTFIQVNSGEAISLVIVAVAPVSAVGNCILLEFVALVCCCLKNDEIEL